MGNGFIALTGEIGEVRGKIPTGGTKVAGEEGSVEKGKKNLYSDTFCGGAIIRRGKKQGGGGSCRL